MFCSMILLQPGAVLISEVYVTTKGYAGVCSLRCHLKPCWCPQIILPLEAMLMFMVHLTVCCSFILSFIFLLLLSIFRLHFMISFPILSRYISYNSLFCYFSVSFRDFYSTYLLACHHQMILYHFMCNLNFLTTVSTYFSFSGLHANVEIPFTPTYVKTFKKPESLFTHASKSSFTLPMYFLF